MAFKLDSKPLATDVAFKTSDGTQYPANWLRLATADEKKKIGITEVADEAKAYDQRFYWGVGNAKRLADENAKDKDGNPLKDEDGNQIIDEGLKTTWVRQQKGQAGNRLAKYDWYVTRKAEKGTAIPSAIVTYRDAIRTTCKTREDEINACSDVAALKKLIDGTYDKDGKRTSGITEWPVDPNAKA
jgi:hypothetical protein